MIFDLQKYHLDNQTSFLFFYDKKYIDIITHQPFLNVSRGIKQTFFIRVICKAFGERVRAQKGNRFVGSRPLPYSYTIWVQYSLLYTHFSIYFICTIIYIAKFVICYTAKFFFYLTSQMRISSFKNSCITFLQFRCFSITLNYWNRMFEKGFKSFHLNLNEIHV